MKKWTNGLCPGLALAAVLSLIPVGSASADGVIAGTIRCVNNDSAKCEAMYASIQDAVNASVPGDIVLVGAGTYNETVTITTPRITLLGAQAGNDARYGRRNPKRESVINATGTGSSNAGIIVEANNVTIDGFTIQGATDGAANGSGIDLEGSSVGITPADGAVVIDNIIQNNAEGISLNFEGFGPVTNVLIEHNVFRNNLDSADNISNGIFTSAMQNVVIEGNDFSGDQTSAMGINNSSNITMADNLSVNDGTFVIFTNTTDSQFIDNQGRRFVNSASAFGGGGAAVAIGGSNSNLLISNNVLRNGATIGIRFTNMFGGSANLNVQAVSNRISGMKSVGLVAASGMLTDSTIADNRITASGGDGIAIESGNSANVLSNNTSLGNSGTDCVDSSTGIATLGTADVWVGNKGRTSSPSGLCSPR